MSLKETPTDEKAHGARRRRTKIEAGKQETTLMTSRF